MALPSDRPAPRDLAAQASAGARSHDVVIAATKILRHEALVDRDRRALRWADDLLKRVVTPEAVIAVPNADELVTSEDTFSLLTQATQALDEPTRARLGKISAATRAAAKGERSARTDLAAENLRQLFTWVSRIALRTRVDAHTSEPSGGLWHRLTTSSSL